MLFFSISSANLFAASWAESMFAVRKYDFGSVTIGAKSEYRFAVTNRFKQQIRVISSNVSCTCTSVSLSSRVIESGQTEYIVATLNTSGQHTRESKATITIHFETEVNNQKLIDSVQLSVSAYIRSDVMLVPGEVEFGAVKQGETSVRKIRLEYEGKDGWELTGVVKSNPYIHVKAEAIPFNNGSFWNNGSINYQITVTLKPDAPAGYVKDIIRFKTNETVFLNKNRNNNNNDNTDFDNSNNSTTNQLNEILVPIHGVVTERIQVKPKPFVVGYDGDDESLAKNIVVRSNRQFRVLGVSCTDKRFQFTFSDNESSIQIISTIFHAKNQNNFDRQTNKYNIQIRTNLPDQEFITLEAIPINYNSQTQ
ncbi:MAG: DUF1573 domain-containing protein [Planctomycetaceae bacterium]|nr:DUF1573 domain-containing protein [Planctomycetaceae bacterium]